MKTRSGATESLITNEWSLGHQADSGKSRLDSVPLKGQNMANARTLRKRIALIAATALGVGLLVATPASATASAGSLSLSASTATSLVTTAATTTATMGFTATATSDTGTVTATLTSKPTNSTLASTNITLVAGSSTTSGTVGVSGQVATLTATAWTSTTTAASGTFTASITPDKTGTYVVTLTPSLGGYTTVATFTVTAPQLAYKLGDGAAATPFSTGTGVAGPANTVTVTARGLEDGTTKRSLVTVSGAGSSIQSIAGTAQAAGTLSGVIAASANSDFIILTPQAGTVTVNLYNETGAGSGIYDAVADATVTITVNGTAQTSTFSAANSTSILNAGSGTTGTADAVVTVDKAITGSQAAVIVVTLKNTLGALLTGSSVTATVSGPGTLGAGASATQPATGRAITSGSTGSTQYVTIWPDGTAGVATITLSVGATAFGTETVTFTGAIASLAATKVTAINMVGANNGSVTVLAKDSAGNAIAGKTVYASSATPTVATVNASAVTSATGVATFNVTGVASGSSVLTFGDLATAPTVSTTASVSVALSTASTITLALDKTTYAPGAKVTVTLTAKDANGALLADGTYNLLTAAGLVATTAVTGTLPSTAAVTLSGGSAVYTLYAPLIAGPFSINGTTAAVAPVNAAAASLALSASASVVATPDPATAANAAAIAAAQASIAALTTTVASLFASISYQVRVLNVLIKRIMAKLHIR